MLASFSCKLFFIIYPYLTREEIAIDDLTRWKFSDFNIWQQPIVSLGIDLFTSGLNANWCFFAFFFFFRFHAFTV